MSETPVTVPFVSFRPMERELDADLRGAFARVLDNSWYIGGREDAAFEKALYVERFPSIYPCSASPVGFRPCHSL